MEANNSSATLSANAKIDVTPKQPSPPELGQKFRRLIITGLPVVAPIVGFPTAWIPIGIAAVEVGIDLVQHPTVTQAASKIGSSTADAIYWTGRKASSAAKKTKEVASNSYEYVVEKAKQGISYSRPTPSFWWENPKPSSIGPKIVPGASFGIVNFPYRPMLMISKDDRAK